MIMLTSDLKLPLTVDWRFFCIFLVNLFDSPRATSFLKTPSPSSYFIHHSSQTNVSSSRNSHHQILLLPASVPLYPLFLLLQWMSRSASCLPSPSLVHWIPTPPTPMVASLLSYMFKMFSLYWVILINEQTTLSKKIPSLTSYLLQLPPHSSASLYRKTPEKNCLCPVSPHLYPFPFWIGF